MAPGFLTASQLEALSRPELDATAATYDVSCDPNLSHETIVHRVLEAQAERHGLEIASGVLEILSEGYGFLRRDGATIGPDDIYISQSQIRRFELRRGDVVEGHVRRPKDNEKYFGIVKVDAVNGIEPDAARARRVFEHLTPVVPTERFILDGSTAVGREAPLDLLAPLGKGQRTLLLGEPRSGKTTFLVDLAESILRTAPGTSVFFVCIDARPEDLTALRRGTHAEIAASAFEEAAEVHVAVAELALERAKRLVELGRDVVILLDSLGRLARASERAAPHVRPGAADAAGLRARRFFGAARSVEEGGSLTIVAAAGSDVRPDELLVDEFRAAAGGEYVLEPPGADAATPRLDVARSFTRSGERLLSPSERRTAAALRLRLARE